ncbi:MAG: glutamate racemase [Clostridiales bacterium]|nr:glutamate racemase [Clostridiales bacterium]
MRIPKGGIAFFDSGIGGLTVLNACEKQFPEALFYYYGDNQHAPYGNLPAKKIRRYVFRAFKKFHRLHVSAAVIACNTATAVCVDELRRKFSFPILGAEPAVCPAALKGGRVVVLATKATCESERFQRLCQRTKERFPNADICAYACEGLAGAIERNVHRADFDFTPYLPKTSADAVVLGCTHYIYIVGQIARYFGCPVYDGNEGIARRLSEVLCENNSSMKNRDCRPLKVDFDPKLGFVTTKNPNDKISQKITNKRSRKILTKVPKNKQTQGLFFLGKQRDYNKNTHEQMFVWLKGV